MHVTAVVVAHDGGSYLPRTLAALAAQTRPADAAIGVDAGSRDNSAALLVRALGASAVTSIQDPHLAHARSGHEQTGHARTGPTLTRLAWTGHTLTRPAQTGPAQTGPARTGPARTGPARTGPARTGHSRAGFGGSVKAGLAELAPVRGDGSEEWIWLLHDDSAPAPEALAELLHAVERAPSVTVAGCKQLDRDAPRKLVDVGLSTSRWAERLTLIEADELDQGQYDGRTDAFAVNSAGMLVRRDVWEHLDGFDPAIPGIGDDVDFCWRNRLAGNRVVVVPSARMFHAADRPHALGNSMAARKAQIHLRLKHTPWWGVPLHAVGAFLGSLLRLIFSIAAKDPGHGAAQLGATITALGRPVAIARGRRNAARTRKLPRAVIRGLQTPRREVWAHRRSLMEAIGNDSSSVTGGSVLSEEPSGDAADDFAALDTTGKGWAGTGIAVAACLALAASLIGLLNLIRADSVSGGALLPLSTTATTIWENASGWWIRLGAGLPGHGDPFDYVLWILSLLGGGNGNAAVVWLLFLAMPLAGTAAWFGAAALTSRRRFRFLAALIWAGAPALQIALNQGRAGALVAHVMMPLVFLALLRATGSAAGTGRFAAAQGSSPATSQLPLKPGVNGTPSWTAAAGAGLALAVVTAAAPTLLVPSFLLIAAAGVALGHRGRTVWWSLLPSAALFAPLVVSVIDRPRALLGDPGLPFGFDVAPLWQQLLGQPVRFDVDGGLAGLAAFGPSPVPWALLLCLLIGAPLLVLATSVLFAPGRRAWLARFLWASGIVLLASGWLAGHVATGSNGNSLLAPFAGPAVSAAVFAFLGAAIVGADLLQSAVEAAPSSAPRRALMLRGASAVAVVVLAAGPLAGLAAWSAGNVVSGSSATAASPTSGQKAAAAADPNVGQPSDGGTRDSAVGSASSSEQQGNNSAPSRAALGTPRLVAPSPVRSLPATASDRGQGQEQSRTLVITADENGSYTSSLVRGAGTNLDDLSVVASARGILGAPGSETLAADDAVAGSLRRAVATIVAGTGVDPRGDLDLLGAGFVVLRDSDSAAQLTASRIDAVPGLVAVGETDSGWLWRVSPSVSTEDATADAAHRARIVDSAGKTVAVLPSGPVSLDAKVPAGPEGRMVVLSERSDPGWTAWAGGRKLTATTSSWAQAFTLPAGGGDLEIRYSSPWDPWLGIIQGIVIGLTALLAIPTPARRSRSGLSRDENSLRKEYSNA